MVRGMRLLLCANYQPDTELSRNDSIVCRVRRWTSLHLLCVKAQGVLRVYSTCPTSKSDMLVIVFACVLSCSGVYIVEHDSQNARRCSVSSTMSKYDNI